MNSIDDLRKHLFETLEGIKSGDINVDQAKVMGEISQTIINSAKVEVDYIRANGGGNSNFIGSDVKQITQTPTGVKTVSGASTVHRLK